MLETLITTATAALLPALADGLRGLMGRISRGPAIQPQNMAEYIQVIEADTQRMHAMAELDSTENTSRWVNNVRAMQRPTATAAIIAAYIFAIAIAAPPAVTFDIGTLAQMALFYLFGDRTLLRNRGARA